MTTIDSRPLARGDRVEIVRGSWAELTGTITLVEYTETPAGVVTPSGYAFVKLAGEPCDLRFRLDMLARQGSAEARTAGTALL